MPSEAAVAVRKRLRDDFPFYAPRALKVRTKPDAVTGKTEIKPFHLNAAQLRLQEVIDRQLAGRGYVRIIILKGRQMGLSTHVGGWLYWWVSQRKAQRAMVIAHDGKATQNLFDMTRRYHENVPEPLRPHTKYSSRKELAFDVLDSSYTVVTAGGDAIGRSETVTAAHLSELAFWPASSAQANFSGVMDTVPSGPGTAIIIESTANGVSGLFYEQCRAARKGEGAFEFLFLPWFIEPAYRLPVPAHFSRTPKEDKLVALYGLDDEQLMFRRSRIAEKGEELFKQEYPCNADEAFLTSGRPVFHPERLAGMLEDARKPLVRKALEGTEWEDHPLGELHCYLPHDPHETYYIGADVGHGVRQDNSVAQVLDSKRRQAAVWRSDRYDADYFGTVLANLGRFYNDAMLICERNGPGILTNRVIHKDEAYPWVYQETQYDKVSDTETLHVGFMTSEKSKPLVINELRAHVRLGEITVYDQTTLDEMRSFIVTQTGRMEAEKGTHDDHVIALALADHINEGAFVPIKNEDSFYVDID